MSSPDPSYVSSVHFLADVFQAEARLAAKRAARAEAREIRMKELERQQKEVNIRENSTSDIEMETRLFLMNCELHFSSKDGGKIMFYVCKYFFLTLNPSRCTLVKLNLNSAQ